MKLIGGGDGSQRQHTSVTDEDISSYYNNVFKIKLPSSTSTSTYQFNFHERSSFPSLHPKILASTSYNKSYKNSSTITKNIFVRKYPVFLSIILLLWVLYLILPKGLRQLICKAYPKRYAVSKDPNRTIRNANTVKVVGLGNHYKDDDERVSGSELSSTLTDRLSSVPNFPKRCSMRDEIQRATLTRRQLLMKRSDSGITSARLNILPAGSSDLSSNPSSGFRSWSGSSSEIHFHLPPSTTENEGLLPLMPKPIRRQLINDSKGSGEEIKVSPQSINSETSEEESMAEGNNLALSSITQPLFFGRSNKQVVGHAADVPFVPYTPLPQRYKIGAFVVSSPTTHQNITEASSPHHPDTSSGHIVRSHLLISSTMKSLREPGVRLNAHGTQCEPRRIWIHFNPDREQLIWRAESLLEECLYPNEVTFGQVHEIPVRDILYVDVGKTTTALRLLSDFMATESDCFSLLTKNGSLDLQAGNQLERDALVSCFCLILDTVACEIENEGTKLVIRKSWRDLYNATLSSSKSSFTKTERIRYNSRCSQFKDEEVGRTQIGITTPGSSGTEVFCGMGSGIQSTSTSGIFTDIE